MKKTKHASQVKKEPVFDRRLEYALLAVFGAYLFLLTSYKAAGDDDLFWHLSTGRYIAETKSVPSADVFGYVTEGKPWIPIEWAWDVLTYITYSAFSYEGLGVLRSMVILAMFYMLYLTMKRFKIPAGVIIVFLFIVSLGLFERYSVRPHLVSYLFTSIVLYILIRLRYSRGLNSRLLYWLPPVYFVWVNFHQGVYFGVLMFAIYIVYEILDAYYFKKPEYAKDKQYIKLLPVFFGTSLICLFLTPHTLNTIVYTYNHAGMKMLEQINEWKSPFDPMFLKDFNIVYYKVILFAGIIALIYSFRRKDYFPAMFVVVFGIISATGIRFVTDYILISSVFIFSSLYYLLTTRKGKTIQPEFVYKPVFSIIIIAALILVSYNIPGGGLYSGLFKEYKVFGTGVDRVFYPMRMFDFAKQNNINVTGKRVFNHYGIGGIFSWYFAPPAQKNFIDSRNLNDEIFYLSDSIEYMKGNYEKRLDEIGVDYVMSYVPMLVDQPQVMSRILVSHLSLHPGKWKLVYWDDNSFLFVKNTPEFADVISKFEYKLLTPYNFGYQLPMLKDEMKKGSQTLKKELERKLAEDPRGEIINTMARTLR